LQRMNRHRSRKMKWWKIRKKQRKVTSNGFA
jgi:hypothetical protein